MRDGRWLKTTGLAAFEHGAAEAVKRAGPAMAGSYGG